MTVHVHQCQHCDRQFPCGDSCSLFSVPLMVNGVEIMQGGHHPCSDCDPPIAAVDDLPAPRREMLSIPTIERVVARATRAAIHAAARDPEDAPDVFAQHVDPMSPRDSTAQDPATWTRIGAVLGAKAAWLGTWQLVIPPDCPPGSCARCYNGAYTFAAFVVMSIRMEMGQC